MEGVIEKSRDCWRKCVGCGSFQEERKGRVGDNV